MKIFLSPSSKNSPASLLLPVGEAKHVNGREEEDPLLGVLSPASSNVYSVISLRSGHENLRRDQNWEER